ncbi:MAG: serpin family protein [Bradymonadales bacterium]|jgi:hypothetical protein
MQRYPFILCLSFLCSLWFLACQPKAEQPTLSNNSIDSVQEAAKDDVVVQAKDDVAVQAVEVPAAEALLPDGTIDEWVDANNRFAWQALKALPAGENVAFSPYLFERVMGMTIAGARGETRAELLKSMGFEKDSANRDALGLQRKKSIFDAPAEGVLLHIASKIYPPKEYYFLFEFMEGLKANYRIAIGHKFISAFLGNLGNNYAMLPSL